MKHFVLLLFALLVASTAGERKRYDEYKAFAVIPQTTVHLDLLRRLKEFNGVDFWQDHLQVNSSIYFMVEPELVSLIYAELQQAQIPHYVHRDNVQTHLDAEWTRLDERFRNPEQNAFNIDDYNRFDDIIAWLEEIKSQCRAGFSCSTEDIGTSVEGRALKVFKLRKSGAGRRVVWSDSLIHAREWLAGATNLKILNHLLTSNDTEVTNLLDKFDFTFLPVMNPDGYNFTWSDDRFWRKSRNDNSGSDCKGTDLNRNYDVMWMTDGASTDPCSNLYGGSGPGSEPETQAVQDYVLANGGSAMIAFISVHTAAQMWLHPYSYLMDDGTCARTPDHDKQTNVGNAAADATENTFDTTWTRGTFCEALYPGSGTTIDFAYAKGNVTYAYTPELRGPGFDPGPEAITPSFEEVWNAYMALINRAAELGP